MENKRVLILHGWGGSDFPHWQAWLASELIKQNDIVSFPSLPNKDFPDFKQWIDFIEKEIKHFSPDMVVCHSLGSISWFHILEKLDIKPLEKLLLVAPVRKDCDIKELKDFFPYKIPENLKANKALLIVSTNDVYMNLHEANELQHELNIEMRILENAGHINAHSGFGKFKEVLDWINE